MRFRQASWAGQAGRARRVGQAESVEAGCLGKCQLSGVGQSSRAGQECQENWADRAGQAWEVNLAIKDGLVGRGMYWAIRFRQVSWAGRARCARQAGRAETDDAGRSSRAGQDCAGRLYGAKRVSWSERTSWAERYPIGGGVNERYKGGVS